MGKRSNNRVFYSKEKERDESKNSVVCREKDNKLYNTAGEKKRETIALFRGRAAEVTRWFGEKKGKAKFIARQGEKSKITESEKGTPRVFGPATRRENSPHLFQGYRKLKRRNDPSLIWRPGKDRPASPSMRGNRPAIGRQWGEEKVYWRGEDAARLVEESFPILVKRKKKGSYNGHYEGLREKGVKETAWLTMTRAFHTSPGVGKGTTDALPGDGTKTD